MFATIVTILTFVIASAVIALLWNRFFHPVPHHIIVVLWALCAIHQAPTLFTTRVDVPANLAFVVQPWQATGSPTVSANTGIVFTQLVPWTRVARDAVLDGEMPLWNRMSASGAPLMANQQTAIFHPFTLLGLILPIGKAFTLSACLRLFIVAFFMFILLRNLSVGVPAAVFGTVAYTFSSFHIIWLLFPLGLATTMLPACLVGVQELSSRLRPASFILLTLSLSATVLGGHPESALWICLPAGFHWHRRPFARLFGS